jgi:hypothetical protein
VIVALANNITGSGLRAHCVDVAAMVGVLTQVNFITLQAIACVASVARARCFIVGDLQTSCGPAAVAI